MRILAGCAYSVMPPATATETYRDTHLRADSLKGILELIAELEAEGLL